MLGSGISTGAGIATGWGVVESLVRQLAIASGEVPGADFDVENWWHLNGDGQPLGYSALLERLGSTRATRRAIVGRFFEPSDEDRELGLKAPSAAHKSIAALVRQGYFRVIVTTNFDRLLETALEAEGISPQVIASDSAIAGMEPLQHMACTILKLHGDYASLDQRNTVDELSAYPSRTTRLLARIADEYGLVVSGWSGDWDPALVKALEANSNRRYPFYWVSRSSTGPTGRRLSSRSGAHLIEGVTADEFFAGLESSLDALSGVASDPASFNLLMGRVKRALPDPTRYIELRDLFESQVAKVRTTLKARPGTPPDNTFETAEAGHREIAAVADDLTRSFTMAVFLDRDRAHSDLWVHTIEQLLRARNQELGTRTPYWDDLQHLPAQMALYGGVAAAISARHEDVAVRLLSEPRWSSIFYPDIKTPAYHALRNFETLNADVVNGFPSYASKWLYPQSHFLKQAMTPILETIVGDSGTEAETLFNRVEYRIALASATLEAAAELRTYPASGEYLVERSSFATSSAEFWRDDFLTDADLTAWGVGTRFNRSELDDKLVGLTDTLKKLTKWG